MDLRFPSTATLSPLSTRTPQIGKASTGTAGQTSSTGSAGFSGELSNALKSVSAAQNKATQMQQEVQMENPNVSLEDTMIAIQKAQIGFQATMHVRNRMVQAYTDIMNMQVCAPPAPAPPEPQATSPLPSTKRAVFGINGPGSEPPGTTGEPGRAGSAQQGSSREPPSSKRW